MDTANNTFQLETRCRIVTDIYKVSRDVMIAWFESARAGDLRTMRQIWKNIVGNNNNNNNNSDHPLVHVNGEGTSYSFVGHSALHWAAANGDIPMMTQLLAWGAAPNAQNKGGATPLHSACSNLRLDSVALLLQHGANPDITDCLNETPVETLRVFAMGGSAVSNNKGGAASLRKIVAEMESLLQLQSLALGMLSSTSSGNISVSSSSSSWTVASMKKLLVGCGLYKSAEEVPKDNSDLTAAAKSALAQFAEKLEGAENSDASFERLRAEFDQKLFAKAAAREQKQQKKQQRREQAQDGEEEEEDDDDETDSDAEEQLLSTKAKQTSQKGNDAFNKGDYRLAAQHYTTAITLSPTDATFYSNRAAAYLKMKAPKKALADAQNAAALRPQWAKPYHRWGCAALDLGMLNDAVAAFRLGLERAPEDASLLAGMESVNAALEVRRRQEEVVEEQAPLAVDPKRNAAAINKSLQELQSVVSGKKQQQPRLPSSSDDDEDENAADDGDFYWHGEHLVKKGFKPPLHDWFDCVLCENKTRAAGKSPCCGRLICDTCEKRRFGGKGMVCPFKCG